MMMQNQADREWQDEELETCRLQLNAQFKANKAQHQMMQMMMTTLMTNNNPISKIAHSIQDSAATGIGMSMELCEGNHDVNAAGNWNTDQDGKNIFF